MTVRLIILNVIKIAVQDCQTDGRLFACPHNYYSKHLFLLQMKKLTVFRKVIFPPCFFACFSVLSYCCKSFRCVAQLGRALRSGRRGRRFKSCRIDEKSPYLLGYGLFCMPAGLNLYSDTSRSGRRVVARRRRACSISCRIDEKKSPQQWGFFLS